LRILNGFSGSRTTFAKSNTASNRCDSRIHLFTACRVASFAGVSFREFWIGSNVAPMTLMPLACTLSKQWKFHFSDMRIPTSTEVYSFPECRFGSYSKSTCPISPGSVQVGQRINYRVGNKCLLNVRADSICRVASSYPFIDDIAIRPNQEMCGFTFNTEESMQHAIKIFAHLRP